MPFGWIDPDVFMTYRDVTIYHVYRHDDYDEGVREYYYTSSIFVMGNKNTADRISNVIVIEAAVAVADHSVYSVDDLAVECYGKPTGIFTEHFGHTAGN